MTELPENWNELTYEQQDLWFVRNVIEFIGEGETAGLRGDVSDEIRDAYAAFLKKGKQ